ncbi:MAG TPA: hypothetical protein VGI97_06015 [Gemmatimonadaceae bacterium]|jgi:hypothetical protein
MPSAADPSDRLQLRQVLTWGVFIALLIAGVVLWFRFSGRMLPLVDGLIGR